MIFPIYLVCDQPICRSRLHVAMLLQERSVGLRETFIIVRLERQPPLLRRPYLLVGVLCFLFRDECLLVATAFLRSINKKLRMTTTVVSVSDIQLA